MVTKEKYDELAAKYPTDSDNLCEEGTMANDKFTKDNPIESDKTYYVEIIKKHRHYIIGECWKVTGTEFFNLSINKCAREITEEEFDLKKFNFDDYKPDETYYIKVITNKYPEILEFGEVYKRLGKEIPTYCTKDDIEIITEKEYDKLKTKEEIYSAAEEYNEAVEEITSAPSAVVEEELSDDEKFDEEMEKEIVTKEPNGFHWLKDKYYDSWSKLKTHCKKEIGHRSENIAEEVDWKFFLHNKNNIRGKPQLIEGVQKRIPLIRQVVKKKKENVWNEAEKKYVMGDEIERQYFYFFDERYDKRYDGNQYSAYTLDFWFYKLVTAEGKEYFILTQEQLPNETCNFNGMSVEMDDFAEISKNMRMKSLARIFFVKSYEPDVKSISPEELVKYTKEKEITVKLWKNLLAEHPNGKRNRFSPEFENLRSAWMLGGKVDGYPLHLMIWGKTGSRKTMGIIETTAHKFSEKPSICEGANSRIKGLIPSFKEKPANIGYLARAERAGFIDEIGKMVEQEVQKHQSSINNVLGDLNALLEHKDRMVGSGNDNECNVKATGKFCMAGNPVGSKNTICEHIGLIDPTMMSRNLQWVQDEEEYKFVLSKEGIEIPPTHIQEYIGEEERRRKYSSEKALGVLNVCRGNDLIGKPNIYRDIILTIFDSCYIFVSKLDEDKIFKLENKINSTIHSKMKNVWNPRANHHIKLLVDGLCKQRCLFQDYDNTFEAKQEDYDLAEKILVRMVKGWETNLIKNLWEDTFTPEEESIYGG